MKKLLFVVALLSTCGGLALAKMQSGPSTAQTVIAKQAGRDGVRKPGVKRKRPFVQCRDGSVSYSRQNVCVGRGGPREIQASSAAPARPRF